MVIVTGIGRCGTSLMIEFIKNLGYNIGGPSYYKKIRAGYEHKPIYRINIGIRQLGNSATPETPISFGEEERTLKEWINFMKVDAYKDPRMTHHPACVRVWWQSRKDIGLIICHRNFEDQYRSTWRMIKTREEGRPPVSMDEFKMLFADFITEVFLIGIPYHIFMFPRFLKEYDYVYESLTGLGLDFDKKKGKEIWDELVNPNFVGDLDMYDEQKELEMEITEQTIKLYDMKFKDKVDIEKIKKAYGNSIKKWVLIEPKNPDDVQFTDIVVPLRGAFEAMPLYVKDTAGLRQWHDDKGEVTGESRFFTVETLDKDTEEPTGLVFKLPVATLREL